MEQQSASQHNERRFQVIEEWHREKEREKIYKIRIYMSSIMIRAEQRIKSKLTQYIALNIPSSTSIASRNNDNSNEMEQEIVNPNIPHSQGNMNIPQPIQPLNAQFQSANHLNQISTKIFQSFKNRGKYEHTKFYFSREKQKLTILLSQNYLLNDVKLKEIDLLYIYQAFTKAWNEDYLTIMSAFMRYSREFKNHDIIKFQFLAIDIIGLTFDVSFYDIIIKVAYYNKVNDKIAELKRFRFRYSIFQFRQNPLFEDKNNEQTMSFIEMNQNNLFNINYNDFYSNVKLGFIDDINNNHHDLWKRVILRFWVFHQLHCLFRGTCVTVERILGVNQFQQFNKKALGRVHFHSTRMKKFQLIFPFPLLNKSVIEKREQGTLYFTFYLDEKDISMSQNGLEFKMIVNMVEHNYILQYDQKYQLFYRLKKQEPALYVMEQRQPIPRQNQLFQFTMNIKFDDKISKAFAKFATIVSLFIDKLSFNEIKMAPNQRQPSVDDIDTEKVLEILAKPITYKQSNSNFQYTHQLIFEFRHKYTQQPYQGQNPTAKVIVTEQIAFFKLIKKRKKENLRLKNKEPENIQKSQVIIHQDFRRYITHVLRNKPLREGYKEIVEFVENVIKIIYKPYADCNSLVKIQHRQIVLTMIISNIIKFLDLSNHSLRKAQIILITEENPLFMRQEHEKDLVAEITFNIKDLKIFWIKRLPEGYIIIRMFENKIQVLKDLASKIQIPVNFGNIQKTTTELMQQLKNILLKEFATLQNMMV